MIILFAGYFIVSTIIYLSSQVYDSLSLIDIFITVLLLAVIEILPFLGFLFGRTFIKKKEFPKYFLFFSGVTIAVIEMLIFNFLITDSRDFLRILFVFVCALSLSQVNFKSSRKYLKESV